MKTEREIARIHGLLEFGAEVADAEILAAVDAYERGMQTNCATAASSLFDAIAPICHYRPHLSGELLRPPIRPLIALGFEEMEIFAVYLSDVLLSPTAPNRSRSQGVGRDWLTNELPKLESVVARVLAEEIEKNNSELARFKH